MRNKRIAILGVTYKAGTSTLRRSLALEVARGLHKKGAALSLSDPLADEAEIKDALFKIPFVFSRDPLRALKDCHAALVIMPWHALKNLSFQKIRKQMKAPFVFFDARNFFSVSAQEIKKAGIFYLGVGNAPTA